MHRVPLPALLLLAPLLWLFRSALFFGEVFAFRDSAHYYFPLYRYVQDAWRSGLPLWNPLDGIGQPLLGDATAAVLYPGKLLFCLPFEYRTCFAIYVVAHLWLAGCGAYWCARYFRAGSYGSLLAGFSYELSGHVLFQYCNPIFCVGAAWLPWAVLLNERMLVDKRNSRTVLRRRQFALLAVVLTMMVLGGDPQMAYHFVLVASLRAGFLSSKRRWPALRTTGKVALLALLLSAVQVLPSAEWAARSDRAIRTRPRSLPEWAVESVWSGKRAELSGLWERPTPDNEHANKTYDFSVGPWRWPEVICPGVTGRWFPINQRWVRAIPAEKRTWTPTLYAGLLAITLVLMRARLFRGHVRVRWLTWLTILCGMATLGEYGIGWLVNEVRYAVLQEEYVPGAVANACGGVYWLLNVVLPGYASFRYPAKWWTVVALGISLLAGIGWRHFFGRVPARKFAVRNVAIVSATSLLPLIAVAVFVLWRGRVPPHPIFGPLDVPGAWVGLLVSFAHMALVAAMLFLWRWQRSASHQAIVLLITVIEIAFANGHLVATSSPVRQLGHESLQGSCIYRCEPPEAYPQSWMQAGSVNRFEELNACDVQTLMPKHHLTTGTRSLVSSVSMSCADYHRLWKLVGQQDAGSGDRSPTIKLLRLLGANYVVAPPDDFGSLDDSVALGNQTAAERKTVPGTNPRAWLVHRWTQLEPFGAISDFESLRARTREVWEEASNLRFPNRYAVVESDAELLESVRTGDAKDECSIDEIQPGRVAVSGYSTSNSILVLSDQFYPDWTITVREGNGARRSADVLRVNRVMKGVYLRSGPFDVEFRYRPRSVRYGAIVSCLSIVTLVLSQVLHARDQKR